MAHRRCCVLTGAMRLAGITLLGSSAWAWDDHRMDATPPVAQVVQAWAWGSNNRGQLGTGTIAYSNVPEQVQGLPPDIVSLAAGGSHVLALDGSGQVWAWGNNDSGQLGVPQHVCRTDYGAARIPCARRRSRCGCPRCSTS